MLESMGLIDMNGHVSVRTQGDSSRFFINSFGGSRAAIGPDDLVEADLQGSTVAGNATAPLEVFIHSAVYAARPDVQAVAHLHSPAVLSLSIAEKEIYPVVYQASCFADGVPVYDDARLINSLQRGEEVAAALGGHRAVILRGHGSVVAAESVKALFAACVYFERNAQHLLEAYRVGIPRRLTPEELSEGSRDLWKPRSFEKIWTYYSSKI